MSGTPKYSRARLDRERKQRLERERRQRAEAEARKRREAQLREQKRRLENRRQRVNSQAEGVLEAIEQQRSHLYSQDANTLQQRCQDCSTQIKQATAETQLQSIAQDLQNINTDLDRAISRKRRDDAEKQRQAEIERYQFDLEELKRQIAQIPSADRLKFDGQGQIQVRDILEKVEKAIAQGNPKPVKAILAKATDAIDEHLKQVSENRAQWQRRQEKAERDRAELEALIIGLKADPVVMRWQAPIIQELEHQNQLAQNAIEAEEFEQVETLLKQCQQQSEAAIETANTAQLKADQRDYIADSISSVLEEMGFNVLQRQPEHPDHPASALILGAVSHAGKSISVSVPTEGEVFYEVEGYVKSTATAVDGGTAATCDEAEGVLNEMHEVLEQEFGVQMGEVWWEGKDPNRNLRQADNLPKSAQQRDRH